MPLVRVSDLKKHFPVTRGLFVQRVVGKVRAVDGISFEIQRGETLGLVGESGCGKTTAGRTMLGLYHPTSGSASVDGPGFAGGPVAGARCSFRRKAQMIFQDP